MSTLLPFEVYHSFLDFQCSDKTANRIKFTSTVPTIAFMSDFCNSLQNTVVMQNNLFYVRIKCQSKRNRNIQLRISYDLLIKAVTKKVNERHYLNDSIRV
jgi:hypothetical protein